MIEKMKELEELLIEILIRESNWAGTPLELAKRLFIKNANEQGLPNRDKDFLSTVSSLLNTWKVDKCIAELSDEFAKELDLLFGQPMWHLKVLTQEESEMFQNLNEIDQAILHLLRNQNNSHHLGAMPREEGLRILKKQGFSIEKVSFHIEDYVREFLSFDNNEPEWWFGLIWAHERTEEYKKIREKQMKEYEEKEARRYETALELDHENENEL